MARPFASPAAFPFFEDFRLAFPVSPSLAFSFSFSAFFPVSSSLADFVAWRELDLRCFVLAAVEGGVAAGAAAGAAVETEGEIHDQRTTVGC